LWKGTMISHKKAQKNLATKKHKNTKMIE